MPSDAIIRDLLEVFVVSLCVAHAFFTLHTSLSNTPGTERSLVPIVSLPSWARAWFVIRHSRPSRCRSFFSACRALLSASKAYHPVQGGGRGIHYDLPSMPSFRLAKPYQYPLRFLGYRFCTYLSILLFRHIVLRITFVAISEGQGEGQLQQGGDQRVFLSLVWSDV